MRNSTCAGMLAALILVAGCRSGNSTTGGDTAPKVALVVVSGSTSTLMPGQTVQLTAGARDASSASIAGKTFSWTSSAPAVASVSQGGLVTALAPGATTISATADGVSGSMALSVVGGPPAAIVSVEVTTPKTLFLLGETAQFSATPRALTGSALSGRTITWTSSQPAVATVSQSGMITAVSAGTTSVVATSEGIASLPTTVTVTGVVPILVEQRVLAQQGLGLALSSAVLLTQKTALYNIAQELDQRECTTIVDQGADSATTVPTAIPYGIRFFFDGNCQRLYQAETVTSLAADTSNRIYHVLGTGAYYAPDGAAMAAVTFDAESDVRPDYYGYGDGQFVGVLNGFATVTPNSTGNINHVGFNCDFGRGGHTPGICKAAGMQNFSGLDRELGFVMTLTVDTDPNTRNLTFTASITSTIGALDALTLIEPTLASIDILGGSTFASTTLVGSAGSFSLFPNTPTGWSITDAAHDATFAISVTDNATRNLTGTIKQTSTGTTLATFALDVSGSGTITYSDGSTSTITSWTLAR